MRKLSILKHKIIRAYHNQKYWEYSRLEGHPENTYFGYDSLEQVIKSVVKRFVEFYGKGLRKWRLH